MHKLNDKRPSPSHIRAVNAAIDYIHGHLDDPLPLEAVARTAAFSPYHFHRIFKAVAGENLSDYVRRARIERAERWLVFREDLPLRDVALECGFPSLSVFSRAFKDVRGLTPTEYRLRYAMRADREETLAEQRFRREMTAMAPDSPIGGIERVLAYARREARRANVRHLPDTTVVFTRHLGIARGAVNPSLARSFDATFDALRRQGRLSASAVAIGASRDSPYTTPSHLCRYDACVAVDEAAGAVPGIESQVLPGGKYAVLAISDTAAVSWLIGDLLVQQWLPASGYRLDVERPFLEIYRNNPAQDPLGRVIIDLCVPILTRKTR